MSADKPGADLWFFGLVLTLSLPFYAQGVTSSPLPFTPALPLSALMACVPMIAALALVTQKIGVAAAQVLFANAFRVRSIPKAWWALVALAWMPVAFVVTGGTLVMTAASMPTLHLFLPGLICSSFVPFFFGAVQANHAGTGSLESGIRDAVWERGVSRATVWRPRCTLSRDMTRLGFQDKVVAVRRLSWRSALRYHQRKQAVGSNRSQLSVPDQRST